MKDKKPLQQSLQGFSGLVLSILFITDFFLFRLDIFAIIDFCFGFL